MALRDRLRRLREKAEEGAVVLHQRDGGIVAFEEMEVHKAMFLAKMDLAQGTATQSEVLDAVRGATPEARADFEMRFGPINMVEHIIAAESRGGWVEVLTLTDDGCVEKVRHECGAEEAERIRREAGG
jgi:hypothetical protein